MRRHAKAPFAAPTTRRIVGLFAAAAVICLALGATVANALAPTVTIEDASDVSYTTAKVKGTVDRSEQATTYRFQYVTQATFEAEGFDNPSTGIEATLEDGGPGAQDVEGTLEGLTPGTTYHLRLYAENADGSNVAVAASTFETLAVAKPTVSLDPITTFDAESASFAGEINPNAPESAPASDPNVETAFATEYRFECTPECPNTPGTQTIPADDGPNAVSFDASDLEPSTEYTVKLFASNRGGEEVAEQSFTTSSLEPTAITHLVANLLSDSARLTGFVDPQNEPTTYFFEWGKAPDLSDAQSLPASEAASAGSGGQQVAVGEDLANLAPNTTYYYRLVSDNSTGPPSVGEIESFTTRETPPPMGSGVGAFGDRVIELVNEPDTSGNRVLSARMSVDGERILYRTEGGANAQSGFGHTTYLLSERTPTGWVSRQAQPPRAMIPDPDWAVQFFAGTPDLSRFLYMATPSLGEGNVPNWEFLTFSPFSGEVEWLGRHGRYEGSNGYVGPDDLSHVFGQSKDGPMAGDPSTIGGLYDFAVDPPQLVGLLPGDAAPTCGVRFAEFPIGGETRKGENWASSDGKRIYFISRGNGDCDANQPHLYLREAGPSGSFGADSGATTTLIGPVFPVPVNKAHQPFLGATSDGSVVFYKTPAALDPDDTDETDDVYRHEIGEGNECITCLVPGVNSEVPRPSEDGSRLYFNSTRALAPGALPGRPNLYVWRAEQPDEFDFIASVRLPGNTLGLLTITPDGSTMVFGSEYNATTGPTLDALTANDNSAGSPVYRYSDAERSLTCVNCEPGGGSSVTPSGIEGSMPERHTNLTDDGTTYIFTTRKALAEGDVNDSSDLYEWRDGEVGLISDGTSPDYFRGGALVAYNTLIQGGISASGRDLVFKSPAALAPGVTETGSQLYDARIGGGFPQVVPPTPCAGDGCRGAPTPPPAPAAAGSAQFAGLGNQPPKPRCARGKVSKRGHCVKPKKRKGQQAKKRSKNKAQNKANSNRGGGK